MNTTVKENSTNRQVSNQAHKSSSEWIEFNIHNLVTFRVARSAPTASLFTDMFGPFLTEGIEHFDLTISAEFEPLEGGAFGEAHGESEFYYNDKGFQLETPEVQIFADEDGFRLHGHSELLVMAVPLIDRLMVARRAAMVHALTVDYRGHGLLIPAWGGTGKTSTMAKLMKIDGFSFMGDDWAFLTADGDLLGYAKPMFIKPYHRPIYPHLFEKTHKPLVPVRLSKQISRITTLVHPYITRYPHIARITRRWSPEHMMVTPQRAFPEAVFSTAAPLAASLFVERYITTSTEPQFEEKDTRWMVSKLIGNFHSELPKQARLVITTLGASGLAPIEEGFCEKAENIRQGLGDKPAFYLRVPKSLAPDQASDIIVSKIQQVLAYAGL